MSHPTPLPMPRAACTWCADHQVEPVLIQDPADARGYRLDLVPCSRCRADAPAHGLLRADAGKCRKAGAHKAKAKTPKPAE